MTDEEPESGGESDETEAEGETEKSFRDRVEELRERRAEGEGEGGSRRDPREAMGGGGPGGMGGGGPGGMGGGGNPFAQMMGGMMGGGGPGGMGGAGGGGGGTDTEGLEREIELLREEVKDATHQLERIADAIQDLD